MINDPMINNPWLKTSIMAKRGLAKGEARKRPELSIEAQGAFHYVYGPYVKPVLTVDPGDVVVVETEDAFGGVITSEQDSPTAKLQFPFLNPQCGPIAVNGVEKGDCLAVVIHAVETRGAQPAGNARLGQLVQVQDHGEAGEPPAKRRLQVGPVPVGVDAVGPERGREYRDPASVRRRPGQLAHDERRRERPLVAPPPHRPQRRDGKVDVRPALLPPGMRDGAVARGGEDLLEASGLEQGREAQEVALRAPEAVTLLDDQHAGPSSSPR